jgi:hypothetical protein
MGVRCTVSVSLQVGFDLIKQSILVVYIDVSDDNFNLNARQRMERHR